MPVKCLVSDLLFVVTEEKSGGRLGVGDKIQKIGGSIECCMMPKKRRICVVDWELVAKEE